MGRALIPILTFVWFGITVGLLVRAAYLMWTLPRFKRPDIAWSDVPLGAEANHLNIMFAPFCLTDEGRRRLGQFAIVLTVFVVLAALPVVFASDRYTS